MKKEYDFTNGRARQILSIRCPLDNRQLIHANHAFIQFWMYQPSSHSPYNDWYIVIGASGKKLKGSGEIIGDRRAKGKVTAIGGAGGFPLLERKKSEWYLRSATEEEIVQGLLKGLDRIEKRFSQKGRPPTQEEIEQKLYFGYGYGYSSSDRSKIVEMLHEGTLLFTNSQFMLKKK